jgi:alpha-beta hydrolase superfamily lysophospholipase
MKKFPIKLFIFICIIVLSTLFAYSLFRLHTKLHVHASEDTAQSPLLSLAKTEYVRTRDGQKVAYWYFPVKNPKAVIIIVHGFSNPGGKVHMLKHAEYLREAGYSTALLDLRSFGESPGKKVSLGVNEWKDVEAVYDRMKSLKENKEKKIGFLGFSMGAATVLTTAGYTGKGDFVIASVPFSDFNSLLHYQTQKAGLPPAIFYPFLKLSAYVELGLHHDTFTPLHNNHAIKVPVFFISATKDQEVNPHDAKFLYEKANTPKEFWEADSPHDVYGTYPEVFRKKVLAFLEKHAH